MVRTKIIKKEICATCGQKVDKQIWKKHVIKQLKKDGLHSMAKLIGMINVVD